jgi:hypothetical protein
VDEGLWRWRVAAKPELTIHEKFGYRVKFSLYLTKSEQDRLTTEHADELGAGVQQSFRSYYTVGVSLGWVDKAGMYQTTKLIDFLAACLGQPQTKKFREWISRGGGPPGDQWREIETAEGRRALEEWLAWWEDLEVYGTITHRAGDRGTFANFAGPMPVGSLPGQKDADYDALARGKLRAIIAESGSGGDAESTSQTARTVTVRLGESGTCLVCSRDLEIRYKPDGERIARCAYCKTNYSVIDAKDNDDADPSPEEEDLYDLPF